MADQPHLLSILSDQPALEDQLNFAPYAKTLADIIADPGTDTPLTIGVFGSWSQGAVEPGRASLGQAAEAESPWNPNAIRDLLTAALDDEGLTALCFDYFQPVYEEFAAGMTKRQKIQCLLDYCQRFEQIELLLDRIKVENPAQYRRFELQLRR